MIENCFLGSSFVIMENCFWVLFLYKADLLACLLVCPLVCLLVLTYAACFSISHLDFVRDLFLFVYQGCQCKVLLSGMEAAIL